MEGGEQCDDGNTLSCDGCSAICETEMGFACGDGSVGETCGEACDDGNTVDGDGCSASCLEQAPPENVSAPAAPNIPVSTDAEADGATSADPIESSVTSPYAGVVDIAESSITGPPPSGYGFLSQQVSISFTCGAPPCPSAAEPLSLVFRIDRSRVPVGEDETTLVTFRDGVAVHECPGSAVAAPDPCVTRRTRLVDDDIEIEVLSAHASEWNLGLPAQAHPVAGRKLLIADSDAQPTKRRLVVVAKDRRLVPAIPDSTGDPRCGSPGGGGGRLQVFGTGPSGHSVDMALPCSNWSIIGRPAAQKGFVYRDGRQADGPCRLVVVKRGTRASAVCTGLNPLHPLGYDLTTGEGGVGVVLTTGASRQTCATFGGQVTRDDDTRFVARNAAAPVSCPTQ